MRRSTEHHQATHSRTGAGSVRPARQPCMPKGQPKIVIGAVTPTPQRRAEGSPASWYERTKQAQVTKDLRCGCWPAPESDAGEMDRK